MANHKMHSKKRATYRDRLWNAQQGLCYWCGVKCSLYHNPIATKKQKQLRFTLDHVVACCFGGTNNQNNLVGACAKCNLARAVNQVRSLKWFKIL